MILRLAPLLFVAVLAACGSGATRIEKSYPMPIGELRDHLLHRNYAPGSLEGMPGWQVETELLDAEMIVWTIHIEGHSKYNCFTQMTPDGDGRDETLVATHCVTPPNDLPDTPTAERTAALANMVDRILSSVTNPFDKKALGQGGSP
ncbi:hypothetical protein [Sphingopyxis sp. KK2]|uniref:hypothetical protein n=1 Tax=Sphingopyxis sp. KK2 TaxID=1855727 RepID=UPI00097E6D11|nr:hypothetical protein [Sphingopyxis sp. KK2]